MIAATIVVSAAAGTASPPETLHPVVLAGYLMLLLSAPMLGYVFMALDIRRYLRSLRRAMVAIGHFAVSGTPAWAMSDRPPCLQTLGLQLPCSEEAVLAAYRLRVKELHPDRGGDLQQFLKLQKHFEQALALARSQAQRVPAAR